MKYTHFFFDLDGTVTNSAPGINHSVQYALQKCGIEPPPQSELLDFIGPPLTVGFSNHFGMDREESLRAVAFYREYYSVSGMLECQVYQGIPALLEELNARGVICVLATCKPHIYAKAILEHFDLAKHFSFVSGPELDGTRGEKDEVIAYAMEKLHLQDPSRILMIGDRAGDAKGAAACGLPCAGVLWGFGDRAELTDAGAAYLVEHPHQLLSLTD